MEKMLKLGAVTTLCGACQDVPEPQSCGERAREIAYEAAFDLPYDCRDVGWSYATAGGEMVYVNEAELFRDDTAQCVEAILTEDLLDGLSPECELNVMCALSNKTTYDEKPLIEFSGDGQVYFRAIIE